MSDIIERLRNRNNPENRWVMMTEAADEIERLNQDREKYFLENLDMKTEIERLREHVAALQLVATAHEPEIERLREENKFLRSLVADELRALEPKP